MTVLQQSGGQKPGEPIIFMKYPGDTLTITGKQHEFFGIGDIIGDICLYLVLPAVILLVYQG